MKALRFAGLVFTLMVWQLFSMAALIDVAGAEFHFLSYARQRPSFNWFEFAAPYLLMYVPVAGIALACAWVSSKRNAAGIGLLTTVVFALLGSGLSLGFLASVLLNGVFLVSAAASINVLAQPLSFVPRAVAAGSPGVVSLAGIASAGTQAPFAVPGLWLLMGAHLGGVLGLAFLLRERR